MTATQISKLKMNKLQLIKLIKSQIVAHNLVEELDGYKFDWSVSDGTFCSSAIISFMEGSKDVGPFGGFNRITLVTAWSSYLYEIARVGQSNEWILSYEGPWNGLNSQNLLIDAFALNEQDIIIESSYAPHPVGVEEYKSLREIFKASNLGFKDQYEVMYGTSVLYTEERNIKYLDEADALSMVS